MFQFRAACRMYATLLVWFGGALVEPAPSPTARERTRLFPCPLADIEPQHPDQIDRCCWPSAGHCGLATWGAEAFCAASTFFGLGYKERVCAVISDFCTFPGTRIRLVKPTVMSHEYHVVCVDGTKGSQPVANDTEQTDKDIVDNLDGKILAIADIDPADQEKHPSETEEGY